MEVVLEALHGKSLAGARLPISKDSCIVSLQRRTHRKPGSSFVYFGLFGLIVINMVESELMLEVVGGVIDVILKVIRVKRFKVIILKQLNPIFITMNLHSRNKHLTLHLSIEWRSHPHHHPHIIVALHFAFSHHRLCSNI